MWRRPWRRGHSPGKEDLGSRSAGLSWSMATGRNQARRPVIERASAAERGEHWWPVATAIIAVAGLHVALPARYRVRPGWVVPAVTLALLAVLIAGDPGRIDRQKAWLRVATGIVIALRWPSSRAPRIVLFAPFTLGHGSRPYLGPLGPAPQGHAGSKGTRPRVARCSGSCYLQFSEDSGALSPGEPDYPPSAPSTLGRNRDGTIPGSRPGEGRLPGGRSTDRAPEPRFPGHARPGPAIGPARHPAGLAQGRHAAAVPGAGRQGRGRSIWR